MFQCKGGSYVARINNKSTIISFENSIKKSNELSMAKLNHGLSLNQMQLLAFSIYCTQQDGKTEFRKVDFEKKFGIEQYRPQDAKKDSQKILSLQLGLEDIENDAFSFWNVFVGMEYKKGTFTFEWTPKMIPHILELKEKYITTDLTVASKFKSSFSWTLYDYIKAHHGYWHKELSKDALLRLFGVEDVKSYITNSGLFKKKVLDVAISEINVHTELEIWYKEQKEGRSIKGFDLIWSNGEKKISATQRQINELKRTLDIIFHDMLEYVDLDDEKDRQRAKELIRLSEAMREHTEEPISITTDKANLLIKNASSYLRELNRMMEQNHKPKRPDFYNWLEDRL